MAWSNCATCSEYLADAAVTALVEEAELTPKPGLVDLQGSGAHTDLTIELMIRSAYSLRQTFAEIALAAFRLSPSQSLREEIARIGRQGENAMYAATGGTNTHKGAIWAIGLLVAGAAMRKREAAAEEIAAVAGELARFPDRFAPRQNTNGSRVRQRYGVAGARGEAQQGFPHVTTIALPALRNARRDGLPERLARIDALIALIATLDDTCLLHRGGEDALRVAKQKAGEIRAAGGVSTEAGWQGLGELDRELLLRHASPGGSADLLAAALFLDRLQADQPNITKGRELAWKR